MAFLGAKVTTTAPDYTDMLGAGVVKYVEERALALTPVGNANIVSALVKGGIGYAAHKTMDGGIGNMISLGFTVDAVEDGITAILGMFLGGSGMFGQGGDNW